MTKDGKWQLQVWNCLDQLVISKVGLIRSYSIYEQCCIRLVILNENFIKNGYVDGALTTLSKIGAATGNNPNITVA